MIAAAAAAAAAAACKFAQNLVHTPLAWLNSWVVQYDMNICVRQFSTMEACEMLNLQMADIANLQARLSA